MKGGRRRVERWTGDGSGERGERRRKKFNRTVEHGPVQQHSSSNNIRFFFSRLTLCFAHIHTVPSVEWLLLGVDTEVDGCVKHVHITVRRCEQFQATPLLEISKSAH